MRSPIFENRFKKDIKRLQKRGKDMNKLKVVIDKLLDNQELEPRYKDHALTGNWNGYRDCHIEPYWLLGKISTSIVSPIEVLNLVKYSNLCSW